MYILEDSNQKNGKHEIKHKGWEKNGDTLIRLRLPVGDYCAPSPVYIDTKQDVTEIACNLCGTVAERDRFYKECQSAQDIGTRLVFLIEDGNYDSIDDLYDVKIQHPGGWPIKGDLLVRRMYECMERYGCEFRFCRKKDTHLVVNAIIEQETS